MAQHDFINKKPKGRNTKKVAPSPKPVSKLLILTALLLVGGFVYGLYFISQNADPKQLEEATKPIVKTPPPVSTPKPKDPDFIQEIKDAEVKVEIKEIKKRGPYQMQCGSFRKHEDAESMKAQIAFVGLVAEIRRTEGSNGVWFRVRLGPYESKRQAESDKNKLKRINIVSCGIWGWT